MVGLMLSILLGGLLLNEGLLLLEDLSESLLLLFLGAPQPLDASLPHLHLKGSAGGAIAQI